jgi:hypothetical protein
VVNVLGDVVYFSEGGYRVLSAVITTGQLKDGDIGTQIQPLTAKLDLDNIPPLVAVWSPSRAQYLCAAGSQVFVYTNSPVSGVTGWTTYQFPWPVQAMCELNGVTYIRREDQPEVYVFDANTTYEEDNFGFEWTWRLPFWDYETDHYFKLFKFIVPHMRGDCTLDFLLDPADLTDKSDSVDIGDTHGNNDVSGNKIPMLCEAEVLSLQFHGTKACTVDEVIVRFETGNIV